MEKLQHQELQSQEECWLAHNQENDFSSLIDGSNYLFDCIKVIFAHSNIYKEKIIKDNFEKVLELFKDCPCIIPVMEACFYKGEKEIAKCSINWKDKNVYKYLDTIPYKYDVDFSKL